MQGQPKKQDHTQQQPHNRGHANRKVAPFRAAISARDSIEITNCVVLDATPTGCRIVVKNSQLLPDEIWLTFDGGNRPIDGEIVWRAGREAGVEFRWDKDK